jgi:hypothetical protein
MPTYVEERLYHPDGMDLMDEGHAYDAFAFQVGVFYRGKGKWVVATSREAHEQLSRTGRWLWLPSKMNQMRWCRHDFETACRLAEGVVNDRKVNGRTWAEWEARRREEKS